VVVQQRFNKRDIDLSADAAQDGVDGSGKLWEHAGRGLDGGLLELRFEFAGGSVGKDEQSRTEVLVEIGTACERSERSAFATLRGEQKNFGIACFRESRCEYGCNGAARDRRCKSKDAVGEIDFDVAANNLQIANTVGLVWVYGNVAERFRYFGGSPLAGGMNGNTARQDAEEGAVNFHASRGLL